MGRSLKKGPFVDPKLFAKVQKQDQQGTKEPIKTWARACTVVPEFVGHTFMVHNGKNHIKVFVTEEMVGHKLGEVSPTRTVPSTAQVSGLSSVIGFRADLSMLGHSAASDWGVNNSRFTSAAPTIIIELFILPPSSI